MYLLTEVLAITTDSAHLPNFKHHTNILRHLILLVEVGSLAVPLAEGITSPAENKAFVVAQLTQVLSSNFTNMNKVQIEAFILGMFNRSNDHAEFKISLRDFLVTSKEIAVDNFAFYADERDKELQEAQNKKAMVPGLIPTHY